MKPKSPNEPYGPPWPFDPLDMNSTVQVDEHSPELSFRQLAEHVKKDMKIMDSLTDKQRLTVQMHNDPNYIPIKPGSGLRKSKRWRG